MVTVLDKVFFPNSVHWFVNPDTDERVRVEVRNPTATELNRGASTNPGKPEQIIVFVVGRRMTLSALMKHGFRKA